MSEKPTKLAEVDLEKMPKVNPEDFKKQVQPLKYRIEIVLQTGRSMMFEVPTGEEAAKFVDSYQMLLEKNAPVARWNIGTELYAIPMKNVEMIKLHKPSPQEMINAQTN